MQGYWDRVVVTNGVAALRATGVPVTEVVVRLETGESPAKLVKSAGLQPLDVIAAVAHDGLGVKDDGGPALVQSRPRRPKLGPALEESALTGLFPDASRTARLALSAGLLQVADFWDASHHAAQLADDLGETAVSAYWHGIAHRREPDPGNASYWFRRVGRHSLFPALADAARPLVASDPSVSDRLLSRGTWDPFAFIEFCSRPRGQEALARAVQRLEMALLLGASVPA